jgi:hypothetical protein
MPYFIGNEIRDMLENEGTHKGQLSITPHIYIAHPPYWLASYLITTHNRAIRNLHTFIEKNTLIKNPLQPKTNSHMLTNG